MLKRVATTLASMLFTLWAVSTGTFLLMEHAPGGPDSAERRLEPMVEAASLAGMGLVRLVRSPCVGVLEWSAIKGSQLETGGPAAKVKGNPGCEINSDVSGTVYLNLLRSGQAARPGQIIMAVRPGILSRYFHTMASLARLDLGVTYSSRGERTVRENLVQTLPVSAAIGALALAIAVLFGFPMGLVSAARRGSWTDRVLTALATAGVSAPAIVLGPCLLYVFAIKLPLFSPGGLESPLDLVLPSTTLGIILASVFQRMTRAGATGFLHGPIAMHLRARGLSEWRIAGIHALRHAGIPMLGFMPPAIAGLLTGSLVVERIFNVPGVSRYLVGAALNRDHPMVLGVVLVYSTALVVLTTLAEILYPLLDPRMKAQRSDRGAT
ncbi:MAG: ABC transporter permease [Deltaproteobacteria bacterium]|nr:ABC transporter permease [Deltaproteobacteria bacterium]